jgi:hypothetical protein
MMFIGDFIKAVECKTMKYQGDLSQYYYNYPEVQLANASNGYSNYFTSDINLMLVLLAMIILHMLHRLILLMNIMTKSQCVLKIH